MESNTYFKMEGHSLKFEKPFYDLGLQEKYTFLNALGEEIYSDFLTAERITRAILQHSSKNMISEFPVHGIRKLSLKAKQVDEKYHTDLVYGLEQGE